MPGTPSNNLRPAAGTPVAPIATTGRALAGGKRLLGIEGSTPVDQLIRCARFLSPIPPEPGALAAAHQLATEDLK